MWHVIYFMKELAGKREGIVNRVKILGILKQIFSLTPATIYIYIYKLKTWYDNETGRLRDEQQDVFFSDRKEK
jgi:hypothetical protein